MVECSPRSLSNDESLKVTVDPSRRHYPTGLEVQAGERYFFSAEGRWLDWFISCGPKGWGPKWNPLAIFNRKRWHRFFLLCGNVGKDDVNAFCIGDKYEWTVPPQINDSPDHQLYLFANDWPCCYRNNKSLPARRGGPLKVTITRLD